MCTHFTHVCAHTHRGFTNPGYKVTKYFAVGICWCIVSMVDASCHSSGIKNFEVAPEKIYAHIHTHSNNNNDDNNSNCNYDKNNSNSSKEVLMSCI